MFISLLYYSFLLDYKLHVENDYLYFIFQGTKHRTRHIVGFQ